jgi:hypothetical protein
MNTIIPSVLFVLALVTQAHAEPNLVGTPVPRVVVISASQTGQTGMVKIDHALELMDKFLKRTEELGGKYTLQQVEDQNWIRYTKRRGEDLTALIVNQTKGCASIDQACIRLIGFYNSSANKPLEIDFAGPVMIPERQVNLKATIDYGNGFRIDRKGNVITYFVKKEIEDSLGLLENNANVTPSVQFVDDGAGNSIQIKLETED